MIKFNFHALFEKYGMLRIYQSFGEAAIQRSFPICFCHFCETKQIAVFESIKFSTCDIGQIL